MERKILIVEDEFIIAQDLKEILHEEGYEYVIHTSNIDHAFEIIKSQNISLILLDIKLNANMDGVDIAQQLLYKDSIPYIFITSHSDKATLERVKEVRPHGIIIKPFKVSDVKASVSIVLNNYIYKNVDVVRNSLTINDDAPLRIKEVVRYIDDNISDKIDVNSLVPLTKWKKHHFIRVFSQYMGVTPYNYIIKKKIEKSKILLEATELTISDIAIDLGFYDASNYCAMFKKLEKTTPHSYRKQYLIRKKLL